MGMLNVNGFVSFALTFLHHGKERKVFLCFSLDARLKSKNGGGWGDAWPPLH